MKKKHKEITCRTCGRIITDSKNKSEVCNSCKGKGVTVAGALLGLGIAAKKFGPTLLKGGKAFFKGGKEIFMLVIRK